MIDQNGRQSNQRMRCIANIARKHAVFCAMALMVCAANSGLCSYLIETTAGNDKARRAARLV